VVAVRLLEALDERGVAAPPAAVSSGLAGVEWPGRLDRRRVRDGRDALLDAAHNPDGAAALATSLRREPPHPIVFAAMRDKDAEAILRHLLPVVSEVVMTQSSNRRSAEPSELAALATRLAPGLDVTIEPDPKRALDAAWRLSSHITIAGSIFLLGDVMEVFEAT
jgi:dihydrofolate synthase/folylpolyglutamate synthase